MSARLDELIANARTNTSERDVAWDDARASRVREGALQRRDARARHRRLARRGLLVASGAGLLLVALLRAASSAPARAEEATPAAASPSSPAPRSEVVAARALGDGGYAHD